MDPAAIASLKAAMARPVNLCESFPIVSQPYHAFDPNSSSWQCNTPSSALVPSETLSALRLISWNIDMLTPASSPRLRTALAHLSTILESLNPSEEAIVIFFQEMTTSDLEIITSTEWIQQRFLLTDIDPEYWSTKGQGLVYGTVTLVDRRLDVRRVFRERVPSRFQRDGLFVDVGLSANVNSNGHEVLRLCNAHLESLVANPPVRPAQLARMAERTKDRRAGVHAALLAGDLNAIEAFDKSLHQDNGLEDAYLSLGGTEDTDEGFTWGYQPLMENEKQFPKSRMDKVLFCGGMEVSELERVGRDVEVQDEGVRKEMREKGMCGYWVSDHLGVMAKVRIMAGKGFVVRGETGN